MSVTYFWSVIDKIISRNMYQPNGSALNCFTAENKVLSKGSKLVIVVILLPISLQMYVFGELCRNLADMDMQANK